MRTLSERSKAASIARVTASPQLRPHCARGSGLNARGLWYMWTVGPFLGKMFLLLIDAHSKWIELHMVNSVTSQMTIKKMKHTFATHGLLEMLVTDNGSNFTSV